MRVASLLPQMGGLTWNALQEDPRYQAAKRTAQSLAGA
jgi:hypothetical protein